VKINEKQLKLSKEEINARRTAKGGFTRDQLSAWGVSWPPPHGWMQALIAGEEREIVEPESFPNSIEAKVLHEVVMALIEQGHGHLIAHVDSANAYYGCNIPTVADIVGGRPAGALIEGGITWDDKVYRFSVMGKVQDARNQS